MNKYTIRTILLVLVSTPLLAGFGLGDLKSGLGGDKDCSNSSDPKKCRKQDKMKKIGTAVVIGVAAKLIADMIINSKSSQTTAEDKVVKDYKAKHKTLPKNPALVNYDTNLKPGTVVKPGTGMLVASDLVVVPGKSTKEIFIKERIAIYDNDDNTKVLKTLIKSVNDKTKRGGAFSNQFSFKLPKGMPQGVYPIKTQVIVNGKEFKPNKKKMQLVLRVDQNQEYEIVALDN